MNARLGAADNLRNFRSHKVIKINNYLQICLTDTAACSFDPSSIFNPKTGSMVAIPSHKIKMKEFEIFAITQI